MERYRTTLILAGVLVVLGAAVFFLQSPNPGGTSTATPTPTTNLWGHNNTDPITAIDVFSGTQHVGLRQEVSGTNWLLVEPIRAEADTLTVNNVVDQLKTLRPTETITDTKDLAPFGLDKPKWKITLKFGGSSPDKPTLLVGNQTPDVVNYYTKLEGKDAVYVVGTFTIEPLKSWLDNPPKVQPTPTLFPLTVLPPDTPTPTGGVTTATPAGAASPPVLIEPGAITGTSTITSTSPGAATSTTPLPPTLAPSPTK